MKLLVCSPKKIRHSSNIFLRLWSMTTVPEAVPVIKLSLGGFCPSCSNRQMSDLILLVEVTL
jgi:hypothetical protein